MPIATRIEAKVVLLACLCSYQHLFAGLTNRSVRELLPGYTAPPDGLQPAAPTPQTLHPADSPHQRYELASEGRRLAVSRQDYTRIVNPSLADLDPSLRLDIADRTLLAKTWRAFERALQDQIKQAAIAG